MTHVIRMLSDANRDFATIVEWLQSKSLDGANRWIDAFDAALTAITEAPLQQSLASEDEFIRRDVRQYFFSTKQGRRYRIVFTVVGNEVRVLRVRGPGQDLLSAEVRAP